MTEMSDISDRVPSPADRKVFLSGDYKEEQLRAAFPNVPCLTIRHSEFGIRAFLGGPVIHEESIKVAGATKAPDYTFRIGGVRDLIDKEANP